jgi:hypothetical protein
MNPRPAVSSASRKEGEPHAMLVQKLPPSVGEVRAERRELGPPHVQRGLYNWSRHVNESCSGLPGCFKDSQLRVLSVRPRLMWLSGSQGRVTMELSGGLTGRTG